MLTLLSPAALWALAALALPLALHLWRRPPQIVQLGSLRFLRTHAVRPWRERRWREWLLLAVRCGLLAGLVLLLARPRWVKPPLRVPQRWIALDPQAVLRGEALRRMQELRAAGYKVHSLEPGWPEAANPAAGPPAEPVDLWSLLREVDASLPVGSSLAVFSPARLRSLIGLRPALRSRVEWIEAADTAGTGPHVWLQSAQKSPTPGQPPAVTVGISEAAGVRFDAAPPSPWRLVNQADGARLFGPGGTEAAFLPAAVPTALRVSILHDADRAEDARYLAAAIRAAATLHSNTLSLQTIVLDGMVNLTSPQVDWIFWLSVHPPPPELAGRQMRLFEDARGPAAERPGWIVSPPGTPGGEFLMPGVRLWRRTTGPLPGTASWTDELGVPLLTVSDAGTRWHFASRFHPDWSDLPRSTTLPVLLHGWLWPAPTTAANDRRRVAVEQARPAILEAGATVLPPALPLHARALDLHGPLAWLAAILFCLERALSHRRTTWNPVAG